ncbi:hypothetical protein [Tenacibaculum sp. M341]|uniref:hypothetical protein n=1 Tax=Tenacibaculum sp. M341 TaxID=2530339 RepID=UPI0010490B8F|nr:hypothetical protein [Tenacibaculum sp. M341]TCI91878.1 hypothetical protein EYW44_10050 [Tenacibaculum sp. M341]
MKLNLIFILIVITIQAQKSDLNLLGNTFSANVNSVCEETPDDNPCAGEQIYIVVTFSEEEVKLIEKGISSCDKETYSYSFKYKWEFINNEIKIHSNPEEVKYTYLKKMRLILKEEELFGFITYDNGKVIEHKFTMNN